MKKTILARLGALLLIPMVAFAQFPTPIQGLQDGTSSGNPANFHFVDVDANGKIIISPLSPSGGCAGTAATPCIIGGSDGVSTHVALTDTSGRFINDPLGATGALGDAASNSPTRAFANGLAATYINFPYFFNGLTWDRQFECTGQNPITVSAASSVRIVTGVVATNVKVCSVSFSLNTATTVQYQQGTTAVTPCDTVTANLTGAYQNIVNQALDFGAASALTTTATGRDVCIAFGASVTGGGVVKFAQY